MKRPLLAVVLAGLLVPGCAAPQPLLPPGENPDRLAEAIARRGQYDGPVNAAPPGSGVVADCVTTSAKVGASACLIALGLAYLVALGMSHTYGAAPSGLEWNQAWDSIWSN
jgi:hypothetical protein